MDRMIYLSMSGAKATMQRQDVLANNLANASTVGFRSELQAFRAVPVRGDGASTRVYAPAARSCRPFRLTALPRFSRAWVQRGAMARAVSRSAMTPS